MIIGLLGFINSGKGTVGDILSKDYGFVKESFAKPVKDATAAIFGWDRELLEGETLASRTFREKEDAFWSEKFNKSFTPRKALQLMGTEVGRDVFHPNLWVDALEKRLDKNKDYVITDVRFPNEMKMIQGVGGKIIRVKRGPEPEWYEDAHWENCGVSGLPKQILKNYPDVHYSEWAWIGFPIDKVIENDSDLSSLKEKVDNYINQEYNIQSKV